MSSSNNLSKNTARIGTDRLLGVGVQERDEEERYVVLPRNAPVSSKIDGCDEIAVSIGPIGYEQLPGVYSIVYVPSTGRKQTSALRCVQPAA